LTDLEPQRSSVESPRWQPAPFVLTYRVGEIALFRRRFRAVVLGEHFFDLGDDPDVPPPPLERLGRDVDAIVTRSHPVRDALPPVSVRDGVLRYVFGRYLRYHTDFGGSFEQYLAKFSAKTRGTLRRKVRHFTGLGDGCAMRAYTRPDDVDAFVRDARKVSALTYQEKLLDAGLPDDPAFVERLKVLAQADAMRAYVLFLHGEPIAYLCLPAPDGVLLYSYLGYDPAHADLSPGTVLQYLALEALFSEKRFRALDFTEGQGEHKKFFGTHATACADICYLRATPAARFWVGLHRGLDRASVAAASLLDRLGLKSRIKRFLRRL
jgi:CelD/BcsL family acetyltransferase involved in cellulose biosynthesis